jgi:signal transduction histidine kinase
VRALPARLRPRLLIALVTTSAVTLAATAFGLVAPLRERIGVQSAESLDQAATGVRASLRRDLRHERSATQAGFVGPRTSSLLLLLSRRTNARVLLTDSTGQVRLYDTATTPDSANDVFRALATGRPAQSSAGDPLTLALPIDNASRRDPGAYFVLALRKPSTDVNAAVQVVRNTLVAAGAIGLAVSVLLAMLISATLGRRLRRLRTVAMQTLAQGPEASPPDDRGRDEVGDLARTLGAMQRALRAQEDARRRFTATASHELRTPLTSLAGMLELLEDDYARGDVDERDARDQIAAARTQVVRLQHLAGELLDLSRLDARVGLRAEPVELHELARAVAAEFHARAATSDVRLHVCAEQASHWVVGDPDAIARIVRILLENALRHSPAGGTVTVGIAARGADAALAVGDEGPGVAEDARESIFERFYRGPDAGGDGGFGLGLAIGRELAQRLHGTLELDPGPPSCFVLRLPSSAMTQSPSYELSPSA